MANRLIVIKMWAYSGTPNALGVRVGTTMEYTPGVKPSTLLKRYAAFVSDANVETLRATEIPDGLSNRVTTSGGYYP